MRGRPTSITREAATAQVVTTALTWDAAYDVAATTVEAGRMTTLTLDASGNITRRTVKDAASQSVPYFADGRVRIWTYTTTQSAS